MQQTLARLREPSTYAGLAVLLALFGIHLPESVMALIVQAGSALAGLAAVVLGERR